MSEISQPPSLTEFIKSVRQRVDNYLDNQLPEQYNIDRAVRYSLFNGGKRVRPALVYAVGKSLGAPEHQLDVLAGALELIHSYSLVHDDLPAMDDDALRRGKPTCHIQFDEASAILAGDALLTYAFELIGRSDLPNSGRITATLASAAGARGMILGQDIDIQAEGTSLSLEQLERMHLAKTGALIRASCELPCVLVDSNEITTKSYIQYARAIGLAFQVRDDILDVTTDTSTLGKPKGSDLAKNKPTYTQLLGLAGAQTKLSELHQQALDSLENIHGDTEILRELADYIVDRTY